MNGRQALLAGRLFRLLEAGKGIAGIANRFGHDKAMLLHKDFINGIGTWPTR